MGPCLPLLFRLARCEFVRGGFADHLGGFANGQAFAPGQVQHHHQGPADASEVEQPAADVVEFGIVLHPVDHGRERRGPDLQDLLVRPARPESHVRARLRAVVGKIQIQEASVQCDVPQLGQLRHLAHARDSSRFRHPRQRLGTRVGLDRNRNSELVCRSYRVLNGQF